MRQGAGLFDDEVVGDGQLRGICLVSRPIARKLDQDGSLGEITRLWLEPGLPYGTASRVLTTAAAIATGRGMKALISYHDRTRHSGCIYKKAGFKKAGIVNSPPQGWATRARSQSAIHAAAPSKRRWRLDLT